ncbi:MAG: flagellar basal body rod protein FlgC [Planctomycetota bacterium]|jgi:flagellar basal-body rod protein FlgC
MVGGIFGMMDTSASALHAGRARMNVIANNMANANTTRTDKTDANGRPIPYRRKRVIYQQGAPRITGSTTEGVHVKDIEDDPSEFRKVHQPGHPDADLDGNVLYPNIHVPMEMVDMMVASRAYEANITAMESAKQIIRGALSIIA